MQTIAIKYKTIEDAAALLVASAPATGDYWGVQLRARFATTRPADIVAHYERTVRERAWAYGARVPLEMQDRMRCGACGRTGCKMWRESNTSADHTKILCGPCAMRDQGKTGTIDADGKHEDDGIRCDQIGWMVPAVPTHNGTFWGYTSVPAEGVAWWRALPT